MDLATIIGIVIALVGAIGGYLVEGGYLLGLISIPSFMIVFGATIGAVFVSLSLAEIKEIPTLVKLTFIKKDIDYDALIEKITELASVARKEGILALERIAEQMDDKFLGNGLIMAVDGTDKETIKSIMEAEVNAVSARHASRAKIFDSAGGYCPTMGILGTVMSMISIMRNLDEPSTLGPKIGMAFTATLYGVGAANILFFPMAEKLKGKSRAELVYMEMCIEGVLSIQAGESPKVIQEKLAVFVNKSKRRSEETKEPSNG